MSGGDHARPPKSPRKGKYVNIRIGFLNDTVHVFQVPVKGVGSLLWTAVVDHLHLLEADYFDLEYTNHNGDECWLDKDKAIIKQLGSADTPLRFCVKFYTPDPGLLEDELTRYLFALQVRKDLLRGELRCSENTAALLASYVVQGEIGDFECEEYPDPTYLAVFKFVPEHLQTHEFMAKVMDYHRQHIGESPSECDLNLLDTARKVELYGVKMQSAKDHEGVSLNLAVAHLGVLVFQHFTKINTFSWAKVRKLSFKRKKFLIKLHADTYGYYKDTVEFFFDSRDRCKLFWKRCIEHHAFFRCQVVSKMPRNKTRMVSRGSSFRYCGRTQKQLVEYVRDNIGKRPHFERSTSGRISSRSASVTPKISSKPGMHSSSADLHTSSGSRSSGSHILESNHTPGTRSNRDSSGAISAMREHSGASSAMRGGVESVDVHSDSSMSGSRSLNSPRLEHGLSIDQEVIEAVNARTEGAMTDDEEEAPDSTHNRHPGMAHVASETKGASSTPSPPVYTEQSSPVRYVGLYSEAVDITPDLPTTAAGINSSSCVVSDSNKLELSNASSPHHCGSAGNVAVTCVDHDSSQSVCRADSGVEPASMSCVVTRSSSPALRSNLNLNLTNITTSSSPSSVSQPPASVLLSVCPAGSASLTSSSSSPSSTSAAAAPPPLQSTSTSTSSTQHNTTVPATCTSTPPLSASQITCYSPSTKQTLPESSVKVKSRGSAAPLGVNDGRNVPARLHHPTQQVSETQVSGQQQQMEERRQGRELGKPFSPLYNAEVAREMSAAGEGSAQRRIVASPSSCVTDIAETLEGSEQHHYQQVRLASSSCRASSLDSGRSTPGRSTPTSPGHRGTGEHGGNSPADTSSQSPGSRSGQLRAAGNVDVEQGSNKLDDDVASKRDDARGCGSVKRSSSPASPGLTKVKDTRPQISNGAAVGAGAPPTRHLEAELTAAPRKLSVGDDLIDDIPYILHRRQDGQRDETSVFKSVKRDGKTGVRQHSRSVSPVQRCSSSTPTPPFSSSTLRSRQRGENVPRPNSVPASVSPSSSIKERSRRLEFINVHKLPSRLSYSSVDDTTSPSGDQGILKSLEDSSAEKNESVKLGRSHACSQDAQSQANTRQSQHSGLETGHKSDASASDADRSESNVQVAPMSSVAESPSTHNSESDSSALSPGVQFYSPKLPGSQRLTLAVGTSVSDESPDRCEGLHTTRISVSSSASSENVADLVSEDGKSEPNLAESSPHSQPQYFEVSKPQPQLGQDKTGSSRGSGNKDVPKSLPIKSLHVKPGELAAVATPVAAADGKSEGQGQPPQPRSSLSVVRRVSNGSDPNHFLIDLPSPAAALFYSENNCESPPATKKEAEDSTANLTFSTFRPEDAEEDAYLKAEAAARNRIKSPVRWALQQSGRDGQEASDYKVIMTEGVVEKSALKKKKSSDEQDKPREPKRVSWHKDGDLEHSYHSDLAANDSSSYSTSTGISSLVNSADIMETLENLRNQHSESDLTNSGSSVTSSETGSEEEGDAVDGSHAPQGQPLSSADNISVEDTHTLNPTGHGLVSRDFGLSTSCGQEKHVSCRVPGDRSPLEPLERLCVSMNSDNFDDEGEADDEDDEPNFPPPPPPIVNLPEEMLQSYESDLPLPDINTGMLASGLQDPLDFLEEQGLPQAPVMPNFGVCSSDSDTDQRSKRASGDSSSGLARFLPRQAKPRLSLDPLAQLEFGDLVADMHCTTSESESDFDAEEANTNIRRLSAVITPLEFPGAAGATASLEKSLQHGLPLYSENPSHRAQLQQQHHVPGGQEGCHVVHKSQPVSLSPSQPQTAQAQSQPPKCLPKPARTTPKPPVPLPAHVTSQQLPGKQAPPPVFPRPAKQPQMGKGKQFDRVQRQKTSPTSSSSMSSSTSSSSSSSTAGVLEVRHHPPPPPPAPPQS